MTTHALTPLPIDTVLPEIVDALASSGNAVLCAPPGAGKTTRVPLALMKSGHIDGKILMLEPRRLAARNAADRLASELGETIGQSVGYIMRGENKSNANTRIDVITEGILTRMLQTDPELTGVGAVLFDEFHERSLNGDLGLALCLEVQSALREDLRLLVMSATLDADPIASLLQDAPVITSLGRSYPVEDIFLPRPLPANTQLEPAMADLIKTALAETEGGILAFLPGEGEIRRCVNLLSTQLPDTIALHCLYGAMPFKEQRKAVQSERNGKRKLVLATSIAETSLTIEDIRIVVDSGKARRARFDPGSGMSRLVTEKVSQAEATQRAGRAGRVAPGKAYKLWAAAENGALRRHAPVEIENADLSGFALDLAQWGCSPDALPLLTPPPAGHYQEAQTLLQDLGALDRNDRITDHGRSLARMPLHPRLAHMLATAGSQAAPLAALLNQRDPLGRAPGVDLDDRLKAWNDGRLSREIAKTLSLELKRLKTLGREDTARLETGAMLSLAYPDRIAKRRKGTEARYVLSGGSGVVMNGEDRLAGEPFVVVSDTDGAKRDARIRQAARITLREIQDLHAERIQEHKECTWSQREKRVVARIQKRIGSVILDDRIWQTPPAEGVAQAMIEGIRQNGLTLNNNARRLCTRVELVRKTHPDLPGFEYDTLMDELHIWLGPYLEGMTTLGSVKNLDLTEALRARLDWNAQSLVERAAPSHFVTPMKRKVPVDYEQEVPQIEVRLQEMFGTEHHPTVAGQPLRVVLLSPAHRPVQTTTDIPAFWDTSYSDVRKDMRGRYPKHPWPENPREAAPTLRTKARQ